MTKHYFNVIFLVAVSLFFVSCGNRTRGIVGGDKLTSIPLKRQITRVQPMTGIVLWEALDNKDTDAIQMEYSYLRYNDIVKEKGVYDWSAVETKLNSSASRSHQMILRFWDTYPGNESSIPDYIKALPDYVNIVAKSEGRDTGFPDWSHPEVKRFYLEFFQEFAKKYDTDPRLAFLQVGFGLWSEYHIYDPEEILGTNFPSLYFQETYVRHLDTIFQETHWMISQDAQLANRSPFAKKPDLLDIDFGIFDDSFHLAWEPGYNYEGWQFFGLKRFEASPAGGEILFPEKKQSDFVDAAWAQKSRQFGISFMICEQWLNWISPERMRQHSMDCGYKFKVCEFKSSERNSVVSVTNTGVAPIYYDAYITVNGIRSSESLKYLQAGDTLQYQIQSGGTNPILTIESDRLVPGQKIGFEADLKKELKNKGGKI